MSKQAPQDTPSSQIQASRHKGKSKRGAHTLHTHTHTVVPLIVGQVNCWAGLAQLFLSPVKMNLPNINPKTSLSSACPTLTCPTIRGTTVSPRWSKFQGSVDCSAPWETKAGRRGVQTIWFCPRKMCRTLGVNSVFVFCAFLLGSV